MHNWSTLCSCYWSLFIRFLCTELCIDNSRNSLLVQCSAMSACSAEKKMPGKHSFQLGFIENCQYAVKLLFDCCCLHSSPYYYCQPTPHHSFYRLHARTDAQPVTEWDELAHNWFSEILLGPKKMGLEAL